MRSSACLLIIGVTLGAACRAGEEDAPATAYRTYSAAVAHGEYITAWSLLSRATQDELTNQARAIAAARGLPAPANGKELAFGNSLRLTREIKSTNVTSNSGDHATVAVVDDKDATTNIALVREDNLWRVDLSAAVRSPGPG